MKMISTILVLAALCVAGAAIPEAASGQELVLGVSGGVLDPREHSSYARKEKAVGVFGIARPISFFEAEAAYQRGGEARNGDTYWTSRQTSLFSAEARLRLPLPGGFGVLAGGGYSWAVVRVRSYDLNNADEGVDVKQWREEEEAPFGAAGVTWDMKDRVRIDVILRVWERHGASATSFTKNNLVVQGAYRLDLGWW